MSHLTAAGVAATRETGCTCGPKDGCPRCTQLASDPPYSEGLLKRQEAFETWEAQTRFLLGKVLTVVDASYSDPVQRKAVKDLVKQQFSEQTKWVAEILTGSRLLCAAGEEMKPV